VARLFISHSSANNTAAIALCNWLLEQGFNDVFLDVDPERGLVAGQRWQEALKAAADRCEAVLFLVSPAWLASKWCLAEFLLAKTLHKRIFGLIVEPVPMERVPAEMAAEWQLCQLVGEDPLRTFEVPIGAKHETIAFREAGLDLLRRGLERAGLDAKSFPWPPPADPTRAPYRGLRALEAQDAAIFFGRDAAIVRGLDRIRGLAESGVDKLFVVLGASGSGKSSFLRAGLWPRLARDDLTFLPLPVIRPQTAVISGSSGLASALALTFERLGAVRPPGRIKEALTADGDTFGQLLDELSSLARRRLVAFQDQQPNPTIVLSIDQAEELFNTEGVSEAATFLQLLAGVLTPAEGFSARRVLALATIRSDRYELLQAEPRLLTVKHDLFNLPPISRAEFKSVIEGPARRVGEAGSQLTIDPALTERLIVDAQGADALPLLAFTLERLYADYGSEGKLTLTEYEKLGGVQGSIEAAIARALSEPGRAPQIPATKEDQLACLRATFIPWLARVDPESGEPMRRVARLGEIPEVSRAVLQRLVEARLLLVDRRAGADVVEVAHESLLRQWPALAAWLQTDSDDLKFVEGVERAAGEWSRNGRREGWLDHRAERLSAAEKVAARDDFRARLGEGGIAYLAACRSRETTERLQKEEALAREAARLTETAAAQARTARLQRRARWVLAAFAAAVAVGVGAVSWQQSLLSTGQRALEAQTRSNAQMETMLREKLQASTPPSSIGETVIDFLHVTIAKAVPAQPILKNYGIEIVKIVPENSKIVLVPHSALYGYGAVVPTASPNFLTQVDTGNVPASFTLVFSAPLDAFSFVRPDLYRATDSGVSFPAWVATALDAQGRQLSSISEALLRSIPAIPGDISAQTYRLRTPNFDRIAAVRFDSDPRLNGIPFAGFSAILIERMVLTRPNGPIQSGR
jgi:hypothetical protein